MIGAGVHYVCVQYMTPPKSLNGILAVDLPFQILVTPETLSSLSKSRISLLCTLLICPKDDIIMVTESHR